MATLMTRKGRQEGEGREEGVKDGIGISNTIDAKAVICHLMESQGNNDVIKKHSYPLLVRNNIDRHNLQQS